MSDEKTMKVKTKDGMEVECTVVYDYTPSYRGYRDSLGVPEEPDEPATVELEEVWYHELDILPMCDTEWIENKILDDIRNPE